MAKTLGSTSKWTVRGKYNIIVILQNKGQKLVCKYTAENGATNAAKHYTATWGINVNESTAKRLKLEN